jgi:hypothetical protein
MKLPQLSLRDLFWLAALVAMGCAWWMRERHLAREIEESTWAWDLVTAHASPRTGEEILKIITEHHPESPYAARLRNTN